MPSCGVFAHAAENSRLFNLVLLTLILLSVLTVLVESVSWIRQSYGPSLRAAEWCFTSLFTIEYIARLVSADHAKRNARSFFGIVDLLAVAPIHLSLLFGVTHSSQDAYGAEELAVGSYCCYLQYKMTFLFQAK